MFRADLSQYFLTVLFRFVAAFSIAVVSIAAAQSEEKPSSLVIGLDADMSAGSAQGGEAIRRGVLLAINEINEAGGVLGRSFKLTVRDHRGNPARGLDNIEAFAETADLVAVVGGIHTPVALAELEAIHRHKILYLGPWAAGTPVVANGYEPNFVFRVSVRDQFAGGFLINAARERGFKNPGLLLWKTGWGRSNEKAMTAAMRQIGMNPPPIEWFNSGTPDMTVQIEALRAKGADVIMLVANATDGLVLIRDMAKISADRQLPIISHWGITGGDFFQRASGDISKIDLSFLQTFSLYDPPFADRAKGLFERYCNLFGPCDSPADMISPVGTAHAYDLIHMLALAIGQAGSTDTSSIRTKLELLGSYQGVMRDYNPPFTPERHDALDASDFRLSRFDEAGAIVPMAKQ